MKTERLGQERDGVLRNLVAEAYYAGERIILKDDQGALAAIVPLEDLEVLSELEGERLYISQR